MNKKVLITLFTGFLLLSNSVVASAQSVAGPTQSLKDDSRIIATTNYQVESDVQKLYERAKRGVTDAAAPKKFGNAKLKDLDGNVIKDITPIQTTQLLKTERKANNEIVDTYSTTYFAEVKDKDLENKTSHKSGKFSTMAIGDWVDSGYGETSYSVLGYDTLVYEAIKVSATATKYRIVRTYGGFRILQTGVTLSYPRVYSDMAGTLADSVTPWSINYDPFYPTSADSFDYTYPNLGYVYNFVGGQFEFHIASDLYVQLTRGGSVWTFNWKNEM